jgi:protein-disulfide isomerase
MRLESATLAALLTVACGPATPPPSNTAPAPIDDQVAAENRRLRGQVADLERELAAARDAQRAAETRASAAESAAEAANAQPEPPAAPPPPRRGPDPDVVYSVPIDGSYAEGARNALVTMVIGTEFVCPYCQRVEPTIDELQKHYGNKLRVVYESFVVHPQWATEPALAMCAAAKQRKGAAMMKALWDQYDKYRAQSDPSVFSREAMLEIARTLRLRRARFERAMNGECVDQIKKEHARLARVGTSGAPSFYINGRHIRGAQPADKFRAVIDQELARARELVAAGINRRSLYAAIVAFGQKDL